jgi:hypothetical protein
MCWSVFIDNYLFLSFFEIKIYKINKSKEISKMELYRIIVFRKGYQVWDGHTEINEYLATPLTGMVSREEVQSHARERRRFIDSLPTVSKVSNIVPTPEEQARGISLRTEYVVRSTWEKDQMLEWFNDILAKKVAAINPALSQTAEAIEL